MLFGVETEQENRVRKVITDAPCLLYATHHKHTIVVQFSQHVPCILAALAEAGLGLTASPLPPRRDGESSDA